jgi:hypothetical protein
MSYAEEDTALSFGIYMYMYIQGHYIDRYVCIYSGTHI